MLARRDDDRPVHDRRAAPALELLLQPVRERRAVHRVRLVSLPVPPAAAGHHAPVVIPRLLAARLLVRRVRVPVERLRRAALEGCSGARGRLGRWVDRTGPALCCKDCVVRRAHVHRNNAR